MSIPLSVILPFYNGSRFVGATVASVLEQTLSSLELIIIDDGSRPEESRILESFNDERVKVIQQANAGASAARNTGIRHARGEWLAFIDQDDLWEPNKLERQVDYIRENPDCKALHTAVRRIRNNGRINIYRKGRLTAQSFLTGLPCPAYLSSTMISKSLILQAGLFDKNIQFSEDLECFLRCALISPFHYLDEVLTTRRNHTTNLSNDSRRVWQGRTRILREYKSEYDSPEAFRRSLYSTHEAFALLAAQNRDWRFLFEIVSELSRQRFSRCYFLYNLAFRRNSKAAT